MFGVDLRELLPPAVVLVVPVHHAVRHLPRPNPVYFQHLLGIRVIRIQSSKLEFGISEQNKKVRAVTLLYLLKNAHPNKISVDRFLYVRDFFGHFGLKDFLFMFERFSELCFQIYLIWFIMFKRFLK